MTRALPPVRRLVVKVGSGLVAEAAVGPDATRIGRLAAELSEIAARPLEVALVSSGAIASGTVRLGLRERPRTIPEKQAAAALGQVALMWHYEQAFAAHGRRVAQVLLTQEDISHRARFLNARNTLLTLLGHGVLPVINENDTVAVEEIKVGDNDNLAATRATRTATRTPGGSTRWTSSRPRWSGSPAPRARSAPAAW
jgi:glutamate 5-kinase